MLIGPSADEAVQMVQWWVPPMSPLKAFSGRNKKVANVFGEWLPHESLPLASAANVKLSPILLEPANMLITNVEIDGGKVPYSVLMR